MMKLKDLLKEAFAWERNSDGSLPTLADATETHSKNLQEQSTDRWNFLKKMGFSIEEMGNVDIAKFVKGNNSIILQLGNNAMIDIWYTINGQTDRAMRPYVDGSDDQDMKTVSQLQKLVQQAG